MSVDELTPAPVQIIAGQGPYIVPHPYGGADELRVTVVSLTGRTVLSQSQFSLSPAAAEVSGALTLDATVAVQHAGAKLAIQRSTRIEQGYRGENARERGLQRQLDRTTQATQDTRRELDSALRTAPDHGPLRPVTRPPEERGGKIFAWSDDGYEVVDGPHLQAVASLIASRPMSFPMDLGWANDPIILNRYDLGWADDDT